MAQKKIKSATDQRKFTLVYNDFLESNLLTHYEKMVFITLKKFADNDTGKAFPSLKTIHQITGISVSQIRRSIEHMKQLGVIKIEHRINENKGQQSNLYILYDYTEIWNVESSEKITEIVNNYEDDMLINILESKGYQVLGKKRPTSHADQSNDVSTQSKHLIEKNNNIDNQKSQGQERYTLNQIQQIFDYDIMIHDNPYHQQDIDSVMNILHTAMNTTKSTIRIAREDKPAMVVIGKLMKLDKDSIMYAIEKFSEQTGRIRNPASYMLTILYSAPEQFNLDIQNLVKYNMAHWDKTE